MNSLKNHGDKYSENSTGNTRRFGKPRRETTPRKPATTPPPTRSSQPQENINPRKPPSRPQPQAYHQRIEREPQTLKSPRTSTPRPIYREERAEEAKPKPVGNTCSPACPLFRCEKRALMIKLVDGKPQTYCAWVNDACISFKCQYAFCSQRYLLPDGKCSAALRSDKKEDAFLKELENLKEEGHLKSLLNRKGLGKDLLY